MFEDPALVRFIVMPLVGTLLGMRDGRLDAKAGVPPFDYTMKETVKATYAPFFMMTVINVLVQANSGQGINVLEAVGMGGLCVGILYTLARNATNRIQSRGTHASRDLESQSSVGG